MGNNNILSFYGKTCDFLAYTQQTIFDSICLETNEVRGFGSNILLKYDPNKGDCDRISILCEEYFIGKQKKVLPIFFDTTLEIEGAINLAKFESRKYIFSKDYSVFTYIGKNPVELENIAEETFAKMTLLTN